MVATKVLAFFVLFFSATCFAEEPSLQSLWDSTSSHIQHARKHIKHMLNLTLNEETQQKVADSVKTACDHFATELDTHGSELQAKANGKHNAALSTAATNAAAHFKTSSQTLKELSGSDLKQKNTEYNKAVDLLLQETKKMIDAGPCDEIASIIRNALNELKNDSENYQNQFHALVGPHPLSSADGSEGHHGQGHDHSYHHHHHGNSHSDESPSSEEKIH